MVLHTKRIDIIIVGLRSCQLRRWTLLNTPLFRRTTICIGYPGRERASFGLQVLLQLSIQDIIRAWSYDTLSNSRAIVVPQVGILSGVLLAMIGAKG